MASLLDASRGFAAAGDVHALELLLRRHPLALQPFLLDVLSAVPESLPVEQYSGLLPQV